MGLLDKLKASPFVRKYSVQFANPAGKESRPFYFFEALHHESAVTWQVSDATLASIDANGVVTAKCTKDGGTLKVTATAVADGATTAFVNIGVAGASCP